MNEVELLEWALRLDNEEREYLLNLAAVENETSIGLASSQDSKVIAVFGWSILGIGTIAVTGILSSSPAVQGVFSFVAIAAAIVVLAAGTFALWPKELSLGVTSSWYLDWRDPEKKQMQAYALAALLGSNRVNDELVKRRSRAQKVMGAALAAQVLFIILALVTEFTAR